MNKKVFVAFSVFLLLIPIYNGMAWNLNETPAGYNQVLMQKTYAREIKSVLNSDSRIGGTVQHDFNLAYPKTLLINNATKVGQVYQVKGTISIHPKVSTDKQVTTVASKTSFFNKRCRFNILTCRTECK